MNLAFRSGTDIIEALSGEEQEDAKKRLAVHSLDEARDLWFDRAHLTQIIRDASADERAALKDWAIHNGSWTAASLGRVASGIRGLTKKGLVYEANYGSYQHVISMPRELMVPILVELFDIPFKTITVKVPESDAEAYSPKAPIWTPFIHDLFQLLSFCRREPLLLTAQGAVYQRQQNKLVKLLWNRGLINEAVVPYTLGFLDRMEFFRVIDHPFQFQVADEVPQLFDKTPAQFFDYLVDYLLDPQRLSWPIYALVSLASLVPNDRALTVSEALKWMSSVGFKISAQSSTSSLVLNELLVAGFTHIQGTEAFQLTSWAKAGLSHQFEDPEPKTSICQPTGEILIPPTVPLGERWRIDALATRVNSERMSTYRIDPAAVKIGVQRGLTAESHAEELSRYLRMDLPDNVRVNLYDWYRTYGRHRLMEVTIIHSEQAEDSRDVETLLGQDFLGRLSTNDVIIPANRIKEIVTRLDKAGSPILPEVAKPSQKEKPKQMFKPVPSAQKSKGWKVALATEASLTPTSSKTLRQLFVQATRHGTPLSITFESPGNSQVRHEMVIPVQAEKEWVQVYVTNERRYILINWSRILDVSLE